MESLSRRAGLIERPRFVALLVLLVGIRFAAATVAAFAGVEGMDTRGLDAAFELYADALIVILVFVIAIQLASFLPRLGRRAWLFLLGALALGVALQWVGTVAPALRIMGGPLAPWADFLLGVTAAAALAVLTGILSRELTTGHVSRVAVNGFRAFGFGFALALLLRSIRLLDFEFLFGGSLPSGVLWTLDFGPSLLLAAIAILSWSNLVLLRGDGPRDRWLALSLPVGIAALGWAAALGVLGGFILSNALAWGGSYTVFTPTSISLTIVGFAVGAFLSTAAIVGRRIPSGAAWLLFGGIAVAALAGIQTSAGLLASFVGLVAAFLYVARGVTGTAAPEADLRASA